MSGLLCFIFLSIPLIPSNLSIPLSEAKRVSLSPYLLFFLKKAKKCCIYRKKAVPLHPQIGIFNILS